MHSPYGFDDTIVLTVLEMLPRVELEETSFPGRLRGMDWAWGISVDMLGTRVEATSTRMKMTVWDAIRAGKIHTTSQVVRFRFEKGFESRSTNARILVMHFHRMRGAEHPTITY